MLKIGLMMYALYILVHFSTVDGCDIDRKIGVDVSSNAREREYWSMLLSDAVTKPRVRCIQPDRLLGQRFTPQRSDSSMLCAYTAVTTHFEHRFPAPPSKLCQI